jgi:zinc protease
MTRWHFRAATIACAFGSIFPATHIGTSEARTASAPAPGAVQDSALTVATLPNGLRYYLRKNTVPLHRVELRLVVNAGSLQEDEDQRGYAHFLEHMAFNGTTHFPGGALVDFLETSGMQFGADLNAFTSQDETVYRLTLPSEDRGIVTRGLDVLQDWASGGITMDSAEVTAERGVIMGEWRTRLVDTASQRVQAHFDTVLFGDSGYTLRRPIGDTTLIEHATPAPIRRFYRDWYRPDNMAIVVVGDFDRAAMESEIKARFGSIPTPTTILRKKDAPLPGRDSTTIDVFRGPVLPSADIIWQEPTPPSNPRDALAQRLVRDLLAQSLDQRVTRMRTRPSRPVITAELQSGHVVRALDVYGVQLITWPDSMERGISAVLTEFERMAQHGIPEPALAHQKAVLLAHMEHAALGAAARSSRDYADSYAEHALTGRSSLLSAQQELALARQILPTITPEVLAKAAATWRQPAGRRIIIQLPEFAHVRPPTRESTLAILDSVTRMHLPVDSAPQALAASLLAKPPQPGRIVGEKFDRIAGITEWTLANGARVILKPTRNDPDALRVRAWSPGGFLMTPDSLFFTPGRMVGRVMSEIGGVGAIDHDALTQRLSTTGVRSMKVDIGYADQSIDLAGSPKDVETLFQLMYLQFTAPLVDSASLDGWESVAKYRGTDFSLDDEFNKAFSKGNPRIQPVTTSLAELATVEQLMQVYHNRFSNPGAFTFIIVGAMTAAEARPMVEKYLASLPGNGVREHPVAAEDHTFLRRANTIMRVLQLPKAQTLLVFDGPFPSAPDDYLKDRQRLSAATDVLRTRLRVRLREQLAGTYTPVIQAENYSFPEERYRVLIGFDAAPERMHTLNRELMNILDSLRTHPVSEAEATRAATVQRRRLETNLQDDDYWTNKIGDYARLGIPLDRIPEPYPERVVTPAELQETANRYLPSDVYIHVTAMPEDSSSYAKHDSTAP